MARPVGGRAAGRRRPGRAAGRGPGGHRRCTVRAMVAYQYPEPDRLTRFVNRVQARAPRWAAPVAVLGCAAAAIGYTLYTDPTRSAPDALSTCVVKLTTGLDCPGCGGTRAFWYVLNGDLPAAARHHIMFVFVLPFLAYLYLAWAGRHLFGWKLPQLRVTPTMLGVFLGGWLVFSVLRNLPWVPFTWFYV
nr:DUF2752 domain-containing protein [Micromonospora sp. DSM 115978]